MTLDTALVLGILLAAMVLFVTERVRVDVVALLVLLALAISGLLTPEQAISGFGDPAVITVWAMFILSGGLARTGVARFLGRQVLRVAGSSEARLVTLIMIASASLSAFMNNVGVTALLLPVVMDLAKRTGRPPSKLLIPLAYSTLLGGLLTLVGTPPNILASAALEGAGLPPFHLFEFTPMGAALVIAGILYMALIGRRLLPDHDPYGEAASEGVQLDRAYGLRERLFAVDVESDSPLVGKRLADSRLEGLSLHVMAILRGGRKELAPDPGFVIEAGDRVVVQGPDEALEGLGARAFLTLDPESVEIEALVSPDIGFAEVTVTPDSSLVGRTIRDIDFRHRFHDCLVLSMLRGGTPLRTHLAEAELQAGDVLLVHGARDQLARIGEASEFEVSPIFDPFVYEMDERLMSCRIPVGSPLVGQTLAESRLGDVFSLGVMAIIRNGVKTLIPRPEERLLANDRLIVKGRPEDLVAAEGLWELPIDTEAAGEIASLESEDVCLAEIVLSPRSTIAGHTLTQLRFRERFGMNVVSVMRGGHVYRDLRYFSLRLGDALLIHGPREKLALLARDPEFIIIHGEVEEAPLTSRAPLSVLLLGATVASVILGLLPVHIAAVGGGVLMVLTGCLTMDEAYRAIEWKAVFLIAGMLPLGIALRETGAADLLTAGVSRTVGGLGPAAVVATLFGLTAICAQVIPTSVVAILLAPIALNTASGLGMSPHALMMTVALAASASFMTPVAHPSNVLVMGPGGYRFTDYVKVGLPLVLVCLAVTVLLLPVLWPLG